MKNIVAFLLVFSSLFASSQTQFLGAPNTTVVVKGNMKVDSIFYLPKRQKTPTDTGALRYQISDSSLYVWTGNAWRKAKNDGTITSVSAGTGMSFTTITSTGSVSADTNILATKSYKQKGDDSLGAIIATKGTGTVTSVGSGYGINGGTITTTGTLTADTLNLATRLRLQKVGDSLGLLISNAGGGTVTGVSAGTGMSFTTITSSGAVNADTLVLSTRSWRQKGIDSVSSLIAAKLNISDTATMLSPYAKSAALGLYLPLTGGTLTGGLIGTTGAFTSSGESNTFGITHSSGSGIALNISKGGNGEGLYVNKTSGTGNAATIVGTLNATTLVKSGGTSTQYLMADGTTSTLTNPVTGTGTTNYIPKWSSSSAQTISQIFDNGTSVGIGTTSPISASTLDVVSSTNSYQRLRSSGTGEAITFYQNSTSGTTASDGLFVGINATNDAFFYNAEATPIRIFTSAVERMRITSAGDVGIGNTSPGYKLDITGTLRNTTGAAFATSSGSVLVGTTTDAGQKLQVNGNVRIATIDSTATAMNMLYSDATGVIKKAAVPSGGITGTGITGYFPKWTGTSTQDTSQLFQLGRNIGIGTASPTFRLHLPDAGSTANQAMIAGTIFGSDGNGITISPNSSNITIKGGQGNGLLYSGTISSVARWGINTTSISDAVFSVDGDVKIVTVDSTSTARNMLYQDANGIIKKSAVPTGLTMADDVITASGSWVATKDAGSGTTINNVAYTTNGTTKMVTIDGNFYSDDFTQETWEDIGTITTAYRPKKSVYFPASLRYEGADFERSDNTDFTGSVVLVYGQLRVTDDGKVQVYASVSSNNIAAGGTSYFLIPFQVSYIIK
jgi:hypothetical protein